MEKGKLVGAANLPIWSATWFVLTSTGCEKVKIGAATYSALSISAPSPSSSLVLLEALRATPLSDGNPSLSLPSTP